MDEAALRAQIAAVPAAVHAGGLPGRRPGSRLAALLIRRDDIVGGDHHVIPVVSRSLTVGLARTLHAPQPGWDLAPGFIQDWRRGA
ncbi:MAG: hypothetical protein KGK09_04870 [Burkholderiales bacterium]|nr:hypothetical protein [Burkholderiales bacterium]